MHAVDRRNRKRISRNDRSRAGNGDRLETVVYVVRLARGSRGGRCRNEIVHRRITRVDRQRTTASGSSLAAKVISLVRVKAGHHANRRPAKGLVRDRIAERTGILLEIARHAVIIAGRKHQLAVLELHAGFVERRFNLRHVIEARGRSRTLDEDAAIIRRLVNHGLVDVRGKTLFSRVADPVLLQRVTHFLRSELPCGVALRADRRGHSKLRVIPEVRRGVRTAVGHSDVRLRTPDGVIRPLHHRLIGAVDRDVLAHYEGVLEALKKLVERDDFFFRKAIGHWYCSWLAPGSGYFLSEALYWRTFVRSPVRAASSYS